MIQRPSLSRCSISNQISGQIAMNQHIFTLTEAKARLSELADLAESGEAVIITRHGKPVLQLVRPQKEKQPIDPHRLAEMTDSLPEQPDSAGEFMRELRSGARY